MMYNLWKFYTKGNGKASAFIKVLDQVVTHQALAKRKIKFLFETKAVANVTAKTCSSMLLVHFQQFGQCCWSK